MKKSLVPVLFLVCLACGKPAKNDTPVTDNDIPEQPAPKEKFYSQDGHFKILFEGEPTVYTEKVPTEVGELDMTSFVYERFSGEAYLVSFTDYPASLLKGVAPMELLQSAKDGILTSMDTHPSAEEVTRLGEYPGMFFKASADDLYLVYQLYMVNNRLYQLVVSRSGSYPADVPVKAFLDSFELVK